MGVLGKTTPSCQEAAPYSRAVCLKGRRPQLLAGERLRFTTRRIRVTALGATWPARRRGPLVEGGLPRATGRSPGGSPGGPGASRSCCRPNRRPTRTSDRDQPRPRGAPARGGGLGTARGSGLALLAVDPPEHRLAGIPIGAGTATGRRSPGRPRARNSREMCGMSDGRVIGRSASKPRVETARKSGHIQRGRVGASRLTLFHSYEVLPPGLFAVRLEIQPRLKYHALIFEHTPRSLVD